MQKISKNPYLRSRDAPAADHGPWTEFHRTDERHHRREEKTDICRNKKPKKPWWSAQAPPLTPCCRFSSSGSWEYLQLRPATENGMRNLPESQPEKQKGAMQRWIYCGRSNAEATGGSWGRELKRREKERKRRMGILWGFILFSHADKGRVKIERDIRLPTDANIIIIACLVYGICQK